MHAVERSLGGGEFSPIDGPPCALCHLVLGEESRLSTASSPSLRTLLMPIGPDEEVARTLRHR